MDIDHIRHLWQNGEVEYSEEAQDRLWQREVTTDNIGEAIQNGRIVEERPGYPYPKYLVQGWATRKVAGLDIGLQLLNVACAMGEDLHIITVYWEK
jgi:hypothetical protein